MNASVPTSASPGRRDPWHLWVDTGGTFTDCLAVSPAGEVHRAKVLSSGKIRAIVVHIADSRTITISSPGSLPEDFFCGATVRPMASETMGVEIERYRDSDRTLELQEELCPPPTPGSRVELVPGLEAPILAAHWVTKTPLRRSLPAMTMRLATTRGTNALLERTGSPTALFITRGFADLLKIGNQQRADLFSLDVIKRQPLYKAVIEVDERIDSSGQVVLSLDLESVRQAATKVLNRGVRAAAIALMHSYCNPDHENLVASILRELGFDHVSVSAALAPMIKIVPRAETAVVNAYLSDVIGSYLERVDQRVEPGPLHVLTSSGSLVRAAGFAPKDSLLSGPAGGVVGAATMALRSRRSQSLAFDMGGTSTDVSRFDGDYDYRFETRVGDAQLLSPSLAIETVAAGGGSICHFDGLQLKVGPESAGADPGPACYGAGGPLTLTDVNLLLGRLRPESFEIPIEATAAERAARDLLAKIGRQAPATLLDREGMLEGLLDIANERMAEAVRRISIRQGYRPGDYALVAFGGAGGQHACAVAELLDIRSVLVPEDAGLLSAVGLGHARVERIVERLVLQPLDEVGPELASLVETVAEEARCAVIAEGVPANETEIRGIRIHLRLAGQETSLGLDYDVDQSLLQAFYKMYQDTYGYRPVEPTLEVETVRVIAASRQRPEDIPEEVMVRRGLEVRKTQSVFLENRWQTVAMFDRSEFSPGCHIHGPALVFESHCATLVHPGWDVGLDSARCLVLTQISGESRIGEESTVEDRS